METILKHIVYLFWPQCIKLSSVDKSKNKVGIFYFLFQYICPVQILLWQLVTGNKKWSNLNQELRPANYRLVTPQILVLLTQFISIVLLHQMPCILILECVLMFNVPKCVLS